MARKRVYLDHNATTFLRPEARDAWNEVHDELNGNASSLHERGRRARAHLDVARARTAAALGAPEDAVVFTPSGTQANNLALLGVMRAQGPSRGLVTTRVEHASVLGAAEQLEREGHPVALAGVDAAGRIDGDEILELATRSRNSLVSVMAANNEVGTLAPLARLGPALGELPPDRRPLFHTDAVQALGRVAVDLAGWCADLATLSAHKIGGPPGVGVLVRRPGILLQPLAFGGGQEHGLSPGTEDVASIVAASVAIELAVAELHTYQWHVGALAESFWRELARRLPSARLLGPELGSPERLPNTLNVSVPGVDGRVLVTRLDLEGLEVSAGSACASGSLEPSHVLLAMGLAEEDARAGLRVSLGRTTTREECEHAVDILSKALLHARAT